MYGALTIINILTKHRTRLFNTEKYYNYHGYKLHPSLVRGVKGTFLMGKTELFVIKNLKDIIKNGD